MMSFVSLGGAHLDGIMMASRKRRQTGLDYEDTSEEGQSGSSAFAPVVPKHSTGRKFCPHCHDFVSLKTYNYHKRLYFDQVSNIDSMRYFTKFLCLVCFLG